jgi:hypothetical protein
MQHQINPSGISGPNYQARALRLVPYKLVWRRGALTSDGEDLERLICILYACLPIQFY